MLPPSPVRPDPCIKLKVTDIRDDSAVFSWDPPEWNGGSPITNYIVKKMEVRFSPSFFNRIVRF